LEYRTWNFDDFSNLQGIMYTERTTMVVYHLREEIGWCTVCANIRVSKTSGMGNSLVSMYQFTLIYRESGTSFTIGAGPGTGRKSKWNTIFRLDIPAGNFGLPLKRFRFFFCGVGGIFRSGKPN